MRERRGRPVCPNAHMRQDSDRHPLRLGVHLTREHAAHADRKFDAWLMSPCGIAIDPQASRTCQPPPLRCSRFQETLYGCSLLSPGGTLGVGRGDDDVDAQTALAPSHWAPHQRRHILHTRSHRDDICTHRHLRLLGVCPLLACLERSLESPATKLVSKPGSIDLAQYRSDTIDREEDSTQAGVAI